MPYYRTSVCLIIVPTVLIALLDSTLDGKPELQPSVAGGNTEAIQTFKELVAAKVAGVVEKEAFWSDKHAPERVRIGMLRR